MTENEAIKRIKDHIEVHSRKERMAIYITVALGMAIKALEEVQEYRKLGTVEEISDLKKRDTALPLGNIMGNDKDNGRLRFGICPSCKKRVSNVEGGNFCQNCGQRLKWED